MRKGLKLSTMIAVILVMAVFMAVAGKVFDYSVKALSTTAGTAVWTNDSDYAAIDVKRIQIQGALLAGDTITVSRVLYSSAYTDTVCTIVCSASKGAYIATNYLGLMDGDKLNFASGTGTGATAIIEYEFQKH